MAVRFDPKRRSWTFVIDLRCGPDGRRRQMFRRGLKTEALAPSGGEVAKGQFGRPDLAADGTVAAELLQWLGELGPDLVVTTLSNYRNAIAKYVIPSTGLASCTHWTIVRSMSRTSTW
jgi:hypothetical protein